MLIRRPLGTVGTNAGLFRRVTGGYAYLYVRAVFEVLTVSGCIIFVDTNTDVGFKDLQVEWQARSSEQSDRARCMSLNVQSCLLLLLATSVPQQIQRQYEKQAWAAKAAAWQNTLTYWTTLLLETGSSQQCRLVLSKHWLARRVSSYKLSCSGIRIWRKKRANQTIWIFIKIKQELHYSRHTRWLDKQATTAWWFRWKTGVPMSICPLQL